MRCIADADKARIERAYEFAYLRSNPDKVSALLGEVLANMRRLEVEQPAQPPYIVALSDEQRRAIYPERY